MNVAPRTIMRIVAQEWGIGIAQLTGKRRITSVARPRQVAMYLIRELLRESFPVIGGRFYADHSTVIGACKRVRQLSLIDAEFAERVSRVIKTIEASAGSVDEDPEVALCPHCHRPYLDPLQRDAAVTGIKEELRTIANRVEAFARAS